MVSFDEKSKVLFYLFGKLDFDSYRRVSHQEIAEWINIRPNHVSRAIKVLKELGIIVEGLAAGKFKTYGLNPEIALNPPNNEKTIVEFKKFKNPMKKGKNTDTDEK